MTDKPADSNRKIIMSLLTEEISLILDGEIFIRTQRGNREAIERNRELPHRLRMLLMLIDGRRTVGHFRAAMTNFRSLDEALDMLIKMSFIERLPVRLDD